jgi:hypothetical protein
VERALTALAAGWCVAPLIGLATIYLCYHLSPNTGGSDHDIANSMMTMVITMVAVAASFIATAYLVRIHVSDSHLRTVQILDAVGTITLLTGAFFLWRSTWMYPVPQYPGFRPILDVEVRTPKEFLADHNAGGRIVVHFSDGEAQETPHRDLIRDDGDAAIYPVELEVSEHHGWSVAVLRNIDVQRGFWERYRFELPMPASPAGALPWSGWITPVSRDSWDMASDVTLRYRWVLAPKDQQRAYEP